MLLLLLLLLLQLLTCLHLTLTAPFPCRPGTPVSGIASL